MPSTSTSGTTPHGVVIPFYIYAGISLLAATLLMCFSIPAFTAHYFHPHTLAITHTMALGWGTMIILGASHQLVPVLIESKLHSNNLAKLSFFLAAPGIPLLVYSFYYFSFGFVAELGAILVNAAVLTYLVNLGISMAKSKRENVHAIFVFTASIWLFLTTLIGLLLIFNFTRDFLTLGSVHYLSLHAHIGIVGWFLLLVIGVASRLVPMFLISKYEEPPLLWKIYYLLNAALVLFILTFLSDWPAWLYGFSAASALIALVIFIIYIRRAYKKRIRKQVDAQVKTSLLSIAMIALPLLFLVCTIILLSVSSANTTVVLAYGFTIFFGWLTAIIFGMTFKTLPFIIWNKVYHNIAGMRKTPTPKELFGSKVFNVMAITYLLGFVGFVAGIFLESSILLKGSTLLLLIAAILYNTNMFRVVTHKEKKDA